MKLVGCYLLGTRIELLEILDGLGKNMNNDWIYCSREVVKDLEGKRVCNHEDWLDILNLHETSWMLFVTIDGRASCEFGWPGKEHE